MRNKSKLTPLVFYVGSEMKNKSKPTPLMENSQQKGGSSHVESRHCHVRAERAACTYAAEPTIHSGGEKAMSRRSIKAGLLFISLMILGGGMSACSGGSAKWKEEVQLSDGRIIVVEREMITEGGGDEWASNRNGFKPKEYRIRFANPDGSGRIVEWRSIKETRTWPEKPLVLDIENTLPVVFSTVSSAGGGYIYSKYLYKNNVWVEEALPETFPQHVTNLLVFKIGYLKDGEFVTLKTKHEMNSDDMRGNRGFAQVGPTRIRRAD